MESAGPHDAQSRLGERWICVAVSLFLAAAVWMVFGQTVHHQFVNYDDNICVYENPGLRNGLSSQAFDWAFTHSLNANWIPLASLSHALDCQIYGLQPGGHHLTSVIIHAANAILLFFLLRGLTGALWRSAFVAAVFAVHPLRAESVAWIAERKDVLSGLFFMLTLWAYARYACNKSVLRRVIWYGISLVLLALGLMSKPMLVTVPFVLLLLDYWPLRRAELWRRLLLEKIPFCLLALVAGSVSLVTQHGQIASLDRESLAARAGNALISCAAYIGNMFYPANLAPFYPFPKSLPLWKVGGALLILAVISVAALAGMRKRRYLMVGWLWFLVMLGPVIGLVQVGNQARADRYTYLSQIGLCMMAAWGLGDLFGRWRRWRIALDLASAAIVAGLVLCARAQTAFWANSTTLWAHTLDCTRDNDCAQNNLGLALADAGKPAEAIEHFKKALEINPDLAEAQNNLGNALAAEGKHAEAMEHYRLASEKSGGFASVESNLGAALAAQGQLPEAIEHYRRAIAMDPNYASAYFNLANALLKSGNPAEAIGNYQQTLQLQPELAEAHASLGVALNRVGRGVEGVTECERAVELKPNSAETQFALADVLAGQGKLDEAVEHYRRSLAVKPDFPDALSNLGITLARQGKFDEAIAQYRHALQVKPDIVETCFNLGIALATQGQKAEAVRYVQQSLDLATAQKKNAAADIIRARLKEIQKSAGN